MAKVIEFDASTEDIEYFAQNMRKTLNEKKVNKINLNSAFRAFVEQLGGEIKAGKSPFNTGGSFARLVVHAESNSDKTKKKFTIEVPSFTSPPMDNYIIAHELAHLMLHVDGQEDPDKEIEFDFSHKTNPSDKNEAQAILFAHELLMPEKEINDAIELFKDNKARIAGYLQVPLEILEERINYLGM